MKIRPNGAIEGTPEELARYVKALGVSTGPVITPVPSITPIDPPRVPTDWDSYAKELARRDRPYWRPETVTC